MSQPARDLGKSGPILVYGLVELEDESGIEVWTDSGKFSACRAVSCLVRPEPGDTVLLSLDGFGKCYIVSVLERMDQTPGANLDFSGHVSLRVRNGALRITADEDLSLAARDGLSFNAETLALHAGQGEVSFGRLSFVGRLLTGQLEKIRIVAETCDHFFSRLTQRLGACFRAVEEHDEVQAGSARFLVDGTMTLHSKNAVHIAEEDVKIDAEQIHLN